MNKTSKKKLAVDLETLRPLRLDKAHPIAGGFVSWGVCLSELVRCPK